MSKNLRLAAACTAVVAGLSLMGMTLAQDPAMKPGMQDGMMDKPMMDMVLYEVTIENLTKGQPLSPPLLATHKPEAFIWKDGESPSEALVMIAEEGHNKALARQLEEAKEMVTDCVATGMAYKIMPGQSKTFMVMAKPGDVLSVATMLAATNDGFTGVSNMKLDGEGPMMSEAMAYDAGSEQNTEKSADVPAPSMGMGKPAPDGNRVKHHEGIMGNGDLDKATMGWDGPVARISVTKKMMDDKMMDKDKAAMDKAAMDKPGMR